MTFKKANAKNEIKLYATCVSGSTNYSYSPGPEEGKCYAFGAPNYDKSTGQWYAYYS